MKSRPDTHNFDLQKDPSAFLNGGANNESDATPTAKVTNKPAFKIPPYRVHREQKVFRLSIDVITALKQAAYDRSEETSSRVTELDLVENALRAYLDIPRAVSPPKD